MNKKTAITKSISIHQRVGQIIRVALCMVGLCAQHICAEEITITREDLNRIFANAQAIGDRRVENLQKGLLIEWITRTYEVRPQFGPVRMDEKYQAIQNEFARRNSIELGDASANSEDLYWSLAGILSTFAAPEVGLGIAVGDFARQKANAQISVGRAYSDAALYDELTSQFSTG
jgi:hypothetical protein